MTQDNASGKLTLSGKSTLTLKNLGEASKAHNHDGKKFVQVEVRKKRVISPTTQAEQKVEIDEATAQKLKLIAEAKEHEARRRQEEEEREKERARQKEQEEQERLQKEKEEAERRVAEAENPVKQERKEETVAEEKFKVKKSKDYDDEDDEDDEEEYRGKKFKKASSSEKPLTREETFEQERKKIMKRSFEPQRRGGKVNLIISVPLMMTMMIMVLGLRDGALRKNSLSLFSRNNRKKKLLKMWLFLKLLQFRNWLTVWQKRVPMLLRN